MVWRCARAAVCRGYSQRLREIAALENEDAIDDMVNQNVGRMLELFDLAGNIVSRTGTAPQPALGSEQNVRCVHASS